MKSIVPVLILLFSVLPTGLKAQALQLAPVKGLTEEIYYTLSGVWESYPGTPPTDRLGTFTWGKARYERHVSVLIDLGAAKPYISQAGTRLKLTAIQKIDRTATRIDCEFVSGADGSGYLILYLRDGILSLEEHFGGDADSIAFDIPTHKGMQRTSGPIKP